jgi:hypothetical protein
MSKAKNKSFNLRHSKTNTLNEFNNIYSKNENLIRVRPYSSSLLKFKSIKTITNKNFQIINEPINLKKIMLQKKISNNDNKTFYSLKDTRTISIGNGREKVRKDARGIPIVKGNKKYKVSFIDFISKEKLIDIVEFQKYDHQNTNNTNNFGKFSSKNKQQTSCKCNIF